jgi:hypothetical protein
VLSMDFYGVPSLNLIGIDPDYSVLEIAQAYAETYQLTHEVRWIQDSRPPESLGLSVDVIMHHGLGMLGQPEREALVSLRRLLRPGGVLIGGFLTPSPEIASSSPWVISVIDNHARETDRDVFDAISPKWMHFHTYDAMADILYECGFVDVEFFPDSACIMPTFVAVR